MGTKGREIVGMDVEQLLKLLNMAFADEWLAYYQYWLGAKVVKGPMKEAVIAELLQHATDELRHADMVATILKQNIDCERCAIGFYKKLLEATQGKDPVTYNMVLQILQDEVAHEEDLQSLAEDLEFMLKKAR